MRTIQILFIFLAISTGVSCKSEPSKPSITSKTSFNTVLDDSLRLNLERLFQMGKIHGMGVALVDSSGVLFQRGYGLMDVKTNKPYTEHSLQNIGSISKTFIGISLLKAQEMDLLHLDDPVNKYLSFQLTHPYFQEDTITIRHLASHTSGIKDTEIYNDKAYVLKEVIADSLIPPIEEILNPPGAKTSIAEFLYKVLAKDGEYYSEEGFIPHRPGTRFEYSNIGATLAALVLENASGTAFDRFCAEHILSPLGMHQSGWSFDAIDPEQHSTLYAGLESVIPPYELITYPDGGLRSSARDMGIYLHELIRAEKGKGRLLSVRGYEELFKPVLSEDHFEDRDAENPYNDEYNLGVFMGHSGRGLIGHTGGDPGINSLMFFDPDTSKGFYIAINTAITDEEGLEQVLSTLELLQHYGLGSGKALEGS